MPTTRSHATLRIFRQSAPGSAAAVTRILGVEPTDSHEAGQPRSGRDPRPWRSATWSLESGLPWQCPLADHLTVLCDVVEPKRDGLIRLAEEDHSLDWFCFIEVARGQGGVKLELGLLRRLAGLPVVLDLDIYASEGHNEDW